MSKAFVIKNKEGKYWQWTYNEESEFVDEIYNAFMHYSKHQAEKDIESWELKDCEIIEVTVAEGDLEEENRVLKRALELCVNVLQREIDGDYIKATEVQAIYEIGKGYFIEQAKKENKNESNTSTTE